MILDGYRRGLNWIKYEFGLSPQRLAPPTRHHCEVLEVLVLYLAHHFPTCDLLCFILSFPLPENLFFFFFFLEPLICFPWQHACKVCHLWTLLAVTMLPFALKTLRVHQWPSKPAEDRRRQATHPAQSPLNAEHTLPRQNQPPASAITALELPRPDSPRVVLALRCSRKTSSS